MNKNWRETVKGVIKEGKKKIDHGHVRLKETVRAKTENHNMVCIECGTAKKLLAFNYAEFDVLYGGHYPFPDRISADHFPGNKSKDFLCGECANKRKVICSHHGQIDDNFALGVPPSCVECESEKKIDDKKSECASFWKKNYPQADAEQDIKPFYFRGALASLIAKIDGKSDESEENTINGFPPEIIGNDERRYEAFLSGIRDYSNKQITKGNIFDLCVEQECQEENNRTMWMLIQIASADGVLDKAEYNFIRKIGQHLSITIPDFMDLAEEISLETSNNKRDKALATTGKAVGTVAKGALIIGGTALFHMLNMDDIVDPKKIGIKSPSNNKKKSPRRFPKTFKKCSTCDRWGGQRNISTFRDYSEIEDYGIKGKCISGPFDRHDKRADSSCSGWIKWTQLK